MEREAAQGSLFALGESRPDPAEVLEEYGHLLDPTVDTPADAIAFDPETCGATVDADATLRAFLEYATRAHALAIVSELMCSDGPLRFSDFQERLDISPKTLSARLSELVGNGFAVRQSYDEIPPRVEYELTRKARDLTPAFQFLYGWASRYDLEPWDESETPAAGSATKRAE